LLWRRNDAIRCDSPDDLASVDAGDGDTSGNPDWSASSWGDNPRAMTFTREGHDDIVLYWWVNSAGDMGTAVR